MKQLHLIILLCFLGLGSRSQLVIDNTMTPAQLVQNVLLGSGITVTNVTFTGADVQIAYFDGTNTNLGFGEGILITTGDVANAIGPNNQGGASTSQSTNGDPDLDQLAGLTTWDAAILEFDFIPTANTVNFDYVFASEEYMEYVGGGINDAFGFFISGPGIAGPYSGGSENIALIPGTTTQVTIDNVNANTNAAYYVDNGDGFTAPMNADAQYVQYDGLTTQLTATSAVTACQTYHIRIVIADGMDSALDSGVFLKAGSLNGGNVTIQASTPSADSIAVEGCASGTVSLSIPTAQANDLDIDYVISGTATNGVDYETINTSITIPAGDTSATFNINPIVDGTVEGTETIVLTIQTSACSQDSVILFIADLDPMQLTAGPDQSVCDGQSATITVEATGGGGGYQFDWNNQADDIQSPTVSPITPTTYTVTVTDQCGSTETTSVDVNVGQLSVIAGIDDNFCTGNSLQIGETPQVGHTYTWTPTTGLSNPNIGNPTVTLTNATDQPITQEYVVLSNDGLCSGTDTVVVTINPLPIASFTTATDACSSDTVNVNFTGTASQNANYSWNFNGATIVSGTNEGPYQITFPSDGVINFTLDIDDSGCNSAQASETINVLAAPNATAGNDASICTGDPLQIGMNSENGITYSWSPALGLDDSNISNPSITTTNNGNSPISQTYILTSDNGVCSNTDEIEVTINPIPTSSFSIPTNACEGEVVDVSFDGTASQQANFSWNFNSGWIYSGGDQGPYQIIFDNAGSYDVTLDIEDFGCNSNQASQTIVVSASPTSDAGLDVEYCQGDNVDIGMIAIPNVVYSWAPLIGLDDHTLASPNVSLQNTGTSTITQDYTLTSSFNGCTSTDVVTVTIYPTPAPSSISPQAQCLENNSFDFTTSGDFENNASTQFSWNFGSTATPSTSNDQDPTDISFSNSGTYAYTLEVTSNGCNGILFTDSITINAMPQVSFDETYYGACVPSTYQLTNTSISDPNADYEWTVDGITYNEENPIVPLVLPGLQDVNLQVSSSEGCISSHSVVGMLEGFPQPEASFVFEDTLSELYPISALNSTASNADSCIYVITHLGESDTIFTCNTNYTFLDTGMFEITQIVFSEQGCVDTTSDTLQVFPELTIYIPNAFMPDNDGSNDLWGAYGTGFIEFELLVFDRWGNEIYSSNDITDHWNGKYQNTGQDQPIGVYVYRVRLVDAHQKESFRSGVVTLLR